MNYQYAENKNGRQYNRRKKQSVNKHTLTSEEKDAPEYLIQEQPLQAFYFMDFRITKM